LIDTSKIRVKRPYQYEKLMDQLKDAGPFETLKDVMVFAACLGLSKNRKNCFKKTSEPIALSIFSGDYDKMVINTIAIKDTNDPFIMGNDRINERIEIFEEYACGGLEIIDNSLKSSKHLSINETLIDMVLAEQGDSNILDEITALADI